MYETFFGLKRRPFLFAPDIDAYFSVEFMEKSRQMIEKTVKNGEGLSLIFGASGTGKTLLLQVLRQSLEDAYTVALVSNSRLETPKDLFVQLAHDLRLPAVSEESVGLRLQLLDFARQESTQSVVLLFDNAQHLSPAVLEELRLLADSVGDAPPLFRAVLAGTMEFEEILTLPGLNAFDQRVASRCYLDSLSGEETSQYILRQTDTLRFDPPSGASQACSSPLFIDEAMRRIYQLTDGVPRLVNQLCTAALQRAAERGTVSIDGSLVNDAWASLQHIDSASRLEQGESEQGETEQADAPLTVQEPVIPPEQIEEIINRKKKTFRLRQFNSVEFGTLSDSEAVETDGRNTSRSFHENEYKPPYPEDDDDDLIEKNLVEKFAESEEDEEPEVYRLPGAAAKPGVPAKLSSVLAELCVSDVDEPDARHGMRIDIPKRKLVPCNLKQRHCKFRRRRLLQKIRHRLGLFAGVLRKARSQETTTSARESDMNETSLQEYGAAVLEGRPPFVRKEPHYAYQTTETAPHEVTYPDPATGVPVLLRWLPERTGDSERFGVSYTEFLNREHSSDEYVEPEPKPEPKPEPAPQPVEPIASIVRTSLHASLNNSNAVSCTSGLEESFEESLQVSEAAISLAELFQVSSSALQRIEESAEFKGLDAAVQRQLESAILRITKAAEKIEQAAEVSERAGRHVSQAAEFVETEVKSAVPAYTDLFKQWSEFQNLISSELEAARQRKAEPLKFQSFTRPQVMIERAVPTIDVGALFQ